MKLSADVVVPRKLSCGLCEKRGYASLDIVSHSPAAVIPLTNLFLLFGGLSLEEGLEVLVEFKDGLADGETFDIDERQLHGQLGA